jgi:phage minor structural protein, N-terminal domain protein
MIYLKEGQIPLNFAYNDEIIQEGNSKYQLSFKFPTNNPSWEELVEETLLLADDLHGEQEFIIFEVEKHHAYITVYANQVATLLNNYSITELSVNNASGDRVMRSLVSSIIREHKFTFSSDIANTHSLNLKNVTVANALFKDKHSIIGQWGGDLIRDKYDIRLLSNGGTNKEALFMYKKNLKSYQQKKSIKDLRTRIHFTKTINSQKEGEKDKVIAVTVDSPLISKYKNIYEGNLDVSDQDVTDEATLRKYGEQYFKTTLCDVIEENIEISVLGTPDEPVQIFDTVTIFYEKYNLDVKKKITKYTYAPMGRKLKTIGFGKIQSNLGTTLATMVDNAIEEKAETMLDAFKLQKNLAQLLKLDRKGIEDKLVELEEKSKGALEVKKALFEADGTIPDVVKAKILDAVEGDIGRLKTIITEAELIKAIQAKLNYADIKNALIDKAFINQIISDEKFTQQFEDGQVTTQNIFTKLKDSIKSNISKEFVTKDGVRKLVNDLTIDADGIRQITQQESSKVFETKKSQLQGVNSYIHKKYSDYPDGRNMSDNSTLKYIGIYTGDKQQAPTNASEYSWTKIKVDGKLYKAYSNSLNGTDFTLVEPDENAKLFAKNRPRVNIVNDNDISDIWQANMFLSFKPNTKYTLTARAKGNSNKLWAYFRNNRTSEEYSWGQLEFRGLETKSITFTTTNDVEDVLFKFVLVPEDEDWTGIQIDWFTIYEGDKRYTDYPVDEPAQYHKYRYFGYVFKEGTPIASDFEWFDLQQTSITNDKYTHIVYSDNADGSNFGREPKKYMGVARTTSPAQPTDKTAYKWFKVTGEDGRDGVDGKSINRNYITDSDKLTNINSGGTNWEKTVENGTLVFTKVRATEGTGIWTQIMPILKDNFQNEVLTWSVDVKASKNISFNNVGQETNGFKGRVDLTTNWQRISHTFTNRYTQHYAFVFYQMIGTCSPGDKVYVRLPKLEKGNVATEWSPAYEDLRGRDGVSNYIHRKYSDYSNGANMSDNSNLKYIGIYTGTSPTPPTTASSYLWSKIKGEDGANGIPGAKGADGRTPYFHTAYANSPTGDRDFSTTNSNDKLYIGTYSDFEIADSTDYRRYKWVKIKGENGRNGNNGRDGVSSYIYRKYSDNANGSPMSDNSSLKYIGIYTGTSATAPTTPSAYTWSKIKGEDGQQGVPGARGSDGRTSYLHTAYANSATGEHDFSTTNSNGKEYIGTYTDFEINDSNDYRRYKWVKIKGENGRNGTDGHTLTANLRLEGGYLNNVTNDVKAYLDVFYDGQKITDGFNARVKFKGGIQNTWSNFWDAKVDNTGFLTNVSWGNKEQPYPIALELIALVTYKNLNTVSNARLDNLPDVRLINETVKKYKTFESTLEGFTSVVGEIDTKVFSKSYFKNNLNSEDVEKTGNDLYFNTKENLVANEYYTILADLDNVPANQQAYIYSASDGGDKKTIQNGLNYWVVKYTTNQTRINLYPLGTNTKVKNVRIYKGDFRVKKDDERENLYSDYGHDDKGFLHLILNKNKINGNVYLVKFDASNFSNGARWDVYNRVGYNQENLTQVFKTKDNEFTFTINDNTTADRMYLRIAAGTSPDISNVEIYDVTLGYAKNKEVSKLESSIKQTKDEIDLKVSKDNVIAAINASVETTGEGPAQGVVKINADKVDIRGVLSAYTGLIGGFRIGRNPNDGGFWLTGQSNFDCGINPGHNAGSNGAQLWAAWGNLWTSAGPNAWWVTAQGIMVCKNTPTFHKGMEVYGRYIDMHGNDIQGDKSGGGKTTVVWWSQINKANSSSSDKRLKTNIKPTKVKALDTLNNIEMVEFVWKKDGKFEKIGAIAQQVQKVEESFIVNDMDDKQTYNDYLRIKYYDTIPYLIKGIQELSTENQQLKSQLKEMNERLTKLEDKINGNL